MSLIQYETGGSGTSTDFAGFTGMMQEDPWDQAIQSFVLPGVTGSAHLVHARTGRGLSCEYRIHGYATRALLQAALNTIDGLTDSLFGDVVNTIGDDVLTWENCTFRGFARGAMRYDPNHDWWVEGRLNWIQRTPN